MSKFKKFFPLLMVVTLICMGFFPVQSDAKGSTMNKEKEIQALANELEYIFSTILVKDKLTGVYLVNEEELMNSHYTADEKAMFLEYAQQFKEQGDYGTNNTFDRCMQDLLGISQVVWNEIKGYIDAKQYLAAAAAILLAAEIAVNPIAIAIFVATCGPSPAG